MHTLDGGPMAPERCGVAPVLTGGRAAGELVEGACASIVTGVPRYEAAAELAATAPGRAALEAAHAAWTNRMHRLRSDDFTAGAVLRVLQAAIALAPRPAPTFR